MDHYQDRVVVAASNYFKSLIFLFTAEKHLTEKDLISSVIESYYSIFHLSISRIKLFKGYKFDAVAELSRPTDVGKKTSHKETQRLVETMVKQSLLPQSFFELLKELEKRRVHVNYGPRISRSEEGYIFDTCTYPSLLEDTLNNIQAIKNAFVHYTDSLQKVSDNCFEFISVYQNILFDDICSKINLYSSKVLNKAKKFHREIYKNYLKI